MARPRRPDPSVDIDRLYQVRLAEFVGARNELAKRAGPAGASIRRLQKPNVAAWAVNQLFWQRRSLWDRLVSTAGQARSAHGKRLSGRGGDVAAAEREHRDAVRAAADEIRMLLREAGEVSSAATLAAVIETLQVLPASPEPPGRLTRPLKPLGLEALAGLVKGSGSTLRGVSPALSPGGPPHATKATRAQEARAARRAADARKRERTRLTGEIRKAAAAERRAVADLARARQALERTEREREHLRERLQFMDKQAAQAAAAVDKQEAHARDVAGRRADLEDRRRALDDGV